MVDPQLDDQARTAYSDVVIPFLTTFKTICVSKARRAGKTRFGAPFFKDVSLAFIAFEKVIPPI